MRALPDAAAPAGTATLRALVDEPTTSAVPAEGTWTIAPGDHLWGVAEVLLALHGGTAPDDAAVDAYVQALVAANHDVLVDPADPDLVLPGQVLVLPPRP
jgi:hypothetical protein